MIFNSDSRVADNEDFGMFGMFKFLDNVDFRDIKGAFVVLV
jgi:hypothetical protein